MGIEQTIVLTPKTSLHIARKLWHSGTGALGIAFFQYSNEDSMFLGKLLVIVALVAFVLEWYRLRNDALNKVFCKFAGLFMRDTELNAPTGFAFYALGVGLSLIFFDRDVALLACCYLVFADPMASIVGIKLGKTKIWNGRSLEGTLAFFTMALMINYFFYHQGLFQQVKNYPLFAIITSLCAAMSEVVCHGKYLDDNMIIPLVSGGIITLSYILL